MPKNTKGGKNFKKKGKGSVVDDKRELILKEDGQEYAQITKLLGNGRMEGKGFDGTTRLCHVRGKMCKKVWIDVGDIVLLGLRDYQDSKADIIHKYLSEEVRRLKDAGELPSLEETASTRIDESSGDIPFDFDAI